MPQSSTQPTGDNPLVSDHKEIVFFGDPMCSWCWGFAPTLNKIYDTFGDAAPLRMVMGGLRAGETQPMDGQMKDYVRGHWKHVAKATGQPFGFSFFEREGFVYNTEPACRAVVTVRDIDTSASLMAMEAIQRAFYRDNADTTSLDVLTESVKCVGVDGDRFRQRFCDEDIKTRTQEDFSFAKLVGVTGFPTIALRDENGLRALTIGYRPYEELQPILDAWINDQLP